MKTNRNQNKDKRQLKRKSTQHTRCSERCNSSSKTKKRKMMQWKKRRFFFFKECLKIKDFITYFLNKSRDGS